METPGGGVCPARGGIGGRAVRGEEGEDVRFGEVETEGFEGDFEFVVVDTLVFVEVEEGELGEGVSFGFRSVGREGEGELVREGKGGTYGLGDFFALLVGERC